MNRQYKRNLKKYFHNFAAIFCILSIFIMTIIIFYSIVMRYIFKSAPFWAEEIARYLLVWSSLFGASIAFENREHIGVEYFTKKLATKIKNKVLIIIDSLSLIFFLFVIFYGIKASITSWNVVSPATGIRMFFPYLGIPVGCFFCLVQILFNLTQNLNNK